MKRRLDRRNLPVGIRDRLPLAVGGHYLRAVILSIVPVEHSFMGQNGSEFAAREGNDPLPASVVVTTEHRHFAQFVWCVNGTIATGTEWIAGDTNERYADARRQTDSRPQCLVGTRGVQGFFIKQDEFARTKFQCAHLVMINCVFRYGTVELAAIGIMFVFENPCVRPGNDLQTAGWSRCRS